MEVRRVAEAAPVQIPEETSPPRPEREIEGPEVDTSRGTTIASGRRSRSTAARVTARPMVISREQEYRYIRKDLQRLLITAGALLVVMIVLLLVLET